MWIFQHLRSFTELTKITIYHLFIIILIHLIRAVVTWSVLGKQSKQNERIPVISTENGNNNDGGYEKIHFLFIFFPIPALLKNCVHKKVKSQRQTKIWSVTLRCTSTKLKISLVNKLLYSVIYPFVLNRYCCLTSLVSPQWQQRYNLEKTCSPLPEEKSNILRCKLKSTSTLKNVIKVLLLQKV